MLTDALCAFLLAIPAGMGVGGGGLLVLYLSLRGSPPVQAQGINLFFYLSAVSSSLPLHIKSGRIRILPLSLLLLSALPAALLGARVASAVPSRLGRILLGSFLLLGGTVTLLRTHKQKPPRRL